MRRMKKLARDTALLTGASLVMRCIGLSYQVWLAGRIGSAGIGLWQLVMSVSSLSATLAISGIRFTATRLVSEELGKGSRNGIAPAVRRCLIYAGVFGAAAFALLYLGAEAIGFLWIGDARTVVSLRIVAFTLPLISLASVLNGSLIARGEAWKSACVQVAEQIAGIGAVMLFLRQAPSGDIALCCAAIAKGNLTADAVSLLLVAGMYLSGRPGRGAAPGKGSLTGRMLRTALPLALSAYARTSLTTLENLLVPRSLRASGFSADAALSGYGTITGMVFPVIGFPSCVLSSLSELIVPELTAAQVRGDSRRIRNSVRKLLRITLLFSCCIAAVLFLLADPIGRMVYHTDTVGRYIRVFAFLVPVMYMDIVTDGCLKGLGQMLQSMSFNVAEACAGVLLIVTVLPKYALNGYIFVLFFCEIFNFTMSILRLRKVTRSQDAKNSG